MSCNAGGRIELQRWRVPEFLTSVSRRTMLVRNTIDGIQARSLACLVLTCIAPAFWHADHVLADEGAIKVELRKIGDQYRIYRDGEPYYVQGAGLEFGSLQKLAEQGGNSLRTWRTENGRQSGKDLLDQAHQLGLTVSMGLAVGSERHGFDYADADAVSRQLAELKREILKYRDHPALLTWIIGNELNLSAQNPRVWDAVNEISKMIHEVDPNHLTTTALAGINPDLVREIRQRAPDLDLLSIQMYADLVNLPKYLRQMNWDGPYLVSEWGATGHWEVPKTPWGAAIENNSTRQSGLLSRTLSPGDRGGLEALRGFLCFSVGAETGADADLVRDVSGLGRSNRIRRCDAFPLDRPLARKSVATTGSRHAQRQDGLRRDLSAA